MNKWKPLGKNILFAPQVKDKIIGDTSRFFLIGEVLAIGEGVKTIKVGDTIGVTQWAINKIIMPDKAEHFFVIESDDFVLAVLSNE